MREAEEMWDHLWGKSPEAIHRCTKIYAPPNWSEKPKEQKWVMKFKHWLFPEKKSCPLPPSPYQHKRYIQ